MNYQTDISSFEDIFPSNDQDILFSFDENMIPDNEISFETLSNRASDSKEEDVIFFEEVEPFEEIPEDDLGDSEREKELEKEFFEIELEEDKEQKGTKEVEHLTTTHVQPLKPAPLVTATTEPALQKPPKTDAEVAFSSRRQTCDDNMMKQSPVTQQKTKMKQYIQQNLQCSRDMFQKEMFQYLQHCAQTGEENVSQSYLQETLPSLFSFKFGDQDDSYSKESDDKLVHQLKAAVDLQDPAIVFKGTEYKGLREDIQQLNENGLKSTPLLEVYKMHKTYEKIGRLEFLLRRLSKEIL